MTQPEIDLLVKLATGSPDLYDQHHAGPIVLKLLAECRELQHAYAELLEELEAERASWIDR